MRASLRTTSRVAAVVLALGLGAAGLATPASAFSRGAGGIWQNGAGGAFSRHSGNFQGRGDWGRGGWNRGDWGPGIGAAVVGGLLGGAIIGSAGYPYYDNGYASYDNGYASDPCVQYQNVYSSAGAYLGRQPVNTCQ